MHVLKKIYIYLEHCARYLHKFIASITESPVSQKNGNESLSLSLFVYLSVSPFLNSFSVPLPPSLKITKKLKFKID